MKKILIILGIVVVLALVWAVGVYNSLVGSDEGVSHAWAQVENVYQRRLDLIPNLVEAVKGYAKHESQTLIDVMEARNQAAQITLLKEMPNSQEEFSKFQSSQDALSVALSRLLVGVERYPDIKANQNFLNLRDELAGTESRMSVERVRFNQASQAYNVLVRQAPGNLIAAAFGFRPKACFTSQEGAVIPSSTANSPPGART